MEDFWTGKRIVIAAVVVVILLLILIISPNYYGYSLANIDSTQAGVITHFQKFDTVVGPGQYNAPFDWGADITPINVGGLQFTVTDEEVAVGGKDSKNIANFIGVVVAGTVFRPGVTPRQNGDTVIPALNDKLWQDNKILYTNDEVLIAKVNELTQQAMKVCVGERDLASAVIGNARNDLSGCIDEQLTNLASPFALDVRGITVPNIIVSQKLKDSVANIAQADQESQEAVAKSTLAYANGLQQQAEVQAEVGVTAAANLAQISAQSTQQAAQQQLIISKGSVQDAQATYDANTKKYQLAQATIQLEIDNLKAQSDNAQVAILAKLYQDNPAYAALVVQQAYAEGLKAVEKVFYIPSDTTSLSVIGGTGSMVNQNGVPVVPIVPINPSANPTPAN